jgi:hypothetical protein
MTVCQYSTSEHFINDIDKALVDWGANGGICGDDMLVLEVSECFVRVSSLAGHTVNQLHIITAQALI